MKPVMLEHGLSANGEQSIQVLANLRSPSGQLALKLISARTQQTEALGLALARLYLEYQGALDNQVVVPLDAHADLYPSSAESDEVNDTINLQRTDSRRFLASSLYRMCQSSIQWPLSLLREPRSTSWSVDEIWDDEPESPVTPTAASAEAAEPAPAQEQPSEKRISVEQTSPPSNAAEGDNEDEQGTTASSGSEAPVDPKIEARERLVSEPAPHAEGGFGPEGRPGTLIMLTRSVSLESKAAARATRQER